MFLFSLAKSSSYHLKIGYYNHTMLYVSVMVTPKKIPVENTQKKKRKKIKTYQFKKINKTQRNTVREERKTK